jgi:solute carrier family 13 (sodium-dependent dicarboxylate transporter), member 2/3/5
MAIYLIFITPAFQQWGDMVQSIFILIIVQMLWIGNVFPIGFTSLIGILLMSLHVSDFGGVMSYIGKEIIWLIFATFILSGAFMESGLAQRLSLNMLKFSHGRGKSLLLIIFMLIAILAVFIPISVGRAGIVISLLIGIMNNIQKDSPSHNLGKAFFIGLNFIVMITGALVITGSNTAVYAYSIFQMTSTFNWNYLTWILLFVPPIIVYVLIMWVAFIFIFPMEKIDSEKVMTNIQDALSKLGKINKKEIKMIGILILTVLLWFTESYHGLSLSVIGFFGAILTMLPGIGIWNWNDGQKEVGWEFLIFIATNLALANVLIEKGALKWISDIIINSISILHEPWHYLVVLAIVTLILRSFFANVFGFVSVMIPLGLIIGESIGGYPPVVYAMVIYLVGLPGYFIVSQGAINLMTFRLGYYQQKDLFKAGIFGGILLILIMAVTAHFYWVPFFE